MKKNLLFIAFLILTVTVYGQKVWDFQDVNVWPISAGIGAGPDLTVTTDGLNIHTGSATATNMGQIEDSGKKIFDGVEYLHRFKFNGGGYSGAAAGDVEPPVFMPTQRYISFQVGGDAIITAFGFTGSNGSARKIFVTDGTKKIGEFIYPISTEVPSGEGVKGTVNYVGPATTLYLFCNAAVNLYKLTTTNFVASSVSSLDFNKTIVGEKFFDVLGREVSHKTKGLVIKKTIYEDGTSSTSKSYIRKED